MGLECDILSKAFNSLNSITLNNELRKVGDCCQFNGVTCNGQKQITGIKLSNVSAYDLNLKAFFEELANLKQLTTLNLYKNNELKGYIPPLPNLHSCDYNMTSFCVVSGSKCKSVKNYCSKDEIKMSNQSNGNPNPSSNEYETMGSNSTSGNSPSTNNSNTVISNTNSSNSNNNTNNSDNNRETINTSNFGTNNSSMNNSNGNNGNNANNLVDTDNPNNYKLSSNNNNTNRSGINNINNNSNRIGSSSHNSGSTDESQKKSEKSDNILLKVLLYIGIVAIVVVVVICLFVYSRNNGFTKTKDEELLPVQTSYNDYVFDNKDLPPKNVSIPNDDSADVKSSFYNEKDTTPIIKVDDTDTKVVPTSEPMVNVYSPPSAPAAVYDPMNQAFTYQPPTMYYIQAPNTMTYVNTPEKTSTPNIPSEPITTETNISPSAPQVINVPYGTVPYGTIPQPFVQYHA
ncbi:hypothetical protein PIROE2DRAFT_13111 [Piromyces sp. E2]|nr:hypothetical protein PIROE2DRAFT_13111 [Piromyces sp. E2]|eukprot:OUM60995.1 hypothetical protein PIROE2DRAFT_13111 [Piromyces sp. E2]